MTFVVSIEVEQKTFRLNLHSNESYSDDLVSYKSHNQEFWAMRGFAFSLLLLGIASSTVADAGGFWLVQI